jgi:hypothetical protein
MTGHGRRSQVLEILRHNPNPLDDDQVAAAAQMNRVYVNQLCRQLAAEGLIVRQRSGEGKLVNVVVDDQPASAATPLLARQQARPRRPIAERRAERVEKLIANFAACVAAFEISEAFPGPSLYFHLRAIERRRQHETVGSLLKDIQFLEYAYAVLPSWGMHRMGPQAAKVGDFTAIVTGLRQQAPALQDLWPLRITALTPETARQAAEIAWSVIAAVKVSTSRTQIVAGSKMLHHILPDLIPPIDRQYTFRFFTGQKMVASDYAAFLNWFPQFATIGTRCQGSIRDAICRGGFMATGEAKVIDNAIMGFMQQHQLSAG